MKSTVKLFFRFGVWFSKFGQFSIEVDSTEFGLFWTFRLASESVLIGFKSFRIGSTDFVSFEAFILGAILWDFQPLESIQFVFWAYPIENWRLTGHYRNLMFSKLGNFRLNHWRRELTAPLLKFLGIPNTVFATNSSRVFLSARRNSFSLTIVFRFIKNEEWILKTDISRR